MILNRDQCAVAMGVSPPTLDKWVRKGCPVEFKGGRGKPSRFNLPAVVEWWGEQQRITAAGSEPDDEERLKLRRLIAETGEAELRFAKARGEVALISDFERATAKLMASIRANIMNVPARAVLQLLGEKDESTFKRIMREELTLALEQAAKVEVDMEYDDEPEAED